MPPPPGSVEGLAYRLREQPVKMVDDDDDDADDDDDDDAEDRERVMMDGWIGGSLSSCGERRGEGVGR